MAFGEANEKRKKYKTCYEKGRQSHASIRHRSASGKRLPCCLKPIEQRSTFTSTASRENPGKLDKATLGRLKQTRLSERYKSQALKQAIEIVITTKKSAKELGVPIGVEALHDMKRGKKKGRGKTFRKAMAPWTYRRVLNRIADKAQENRVRLVRVDPANTSRTCPDCGAAHKENRKGEKFRCLTCGRTGHADTIGATNVLTRTLATLAECRVPQALKGVGIVFYSSLNSPNLLLSMISLLPG
jgi:putative transposase